MGKKRVRRLSALLDGIDGLGELIHVFGLLLQISVGGEATLFCIVQSSLDPEAAFRFQLNTHLNIGPLDDYILQSCQLTYL